MLRTSGHPDAGAVKDSNAAFVPAWPRRLFPLVRQLSRRLTPILLRLPLTPNHITLAAIAAGLSASWCLHLGDRVTALVGCFLFIACQVLDNCDGEVARLKGMTSRLGDVLDDSGDALVHSTLFVALGARASAADGQALWFWLGVVTAAGVGFEYVFGLLRKSKEPTGGPKPATSDPTASVSPFDFPGETRWMDKAVYVLRVLIDADFCFMLPVFVLSGTEWLLVAAGAVGNQVYWMAAFYQQASKYRA